MEEEWKYIDLEKIDKNTVGHYSHIISNSLLNCEYSFDAILDLIESGELDNPIVFESDIIGIERLDDVLKRLKTNAQRVSNFNSYLRSKKKK